MKWLEILKICGMFGSIAKETKGVEHSGGGVGGDEGLNIRARASIEVAYSQTVLDVQPCRQAYLCAQVKPSFPYKFTFSPTEVQLLANFLRPPTPSTRSTSPARFLLELSVNKRRISSITRAIPRDPLQKWHPNAGCRLQPWTVKAAHANELGIHQTVDRRNTPPQQRLQPRQPFSLIPRTTWPSPQRTRNHAIMKPLSRPSTETSIRCATSSPAKSVTACCTNPTALLADTPTATAACPTGWARTTR